MAEAESSAVARDPAQPDQENPAPAEVATALNNEQTASSEAGQEDVDVPPPRVIEVERKFIVPEDCTSRLEELGAELLKTSTFTDEYFDVPQLTLTTEDYWLRKRDGLFQLKFPAVKKNVGSSSTQYVELEKEDAILEKVSGVLEVESGSMTLTEFLNHSKCTSFSCFTTNRLSYSLDSFEIVLDETNFGYSVGEIERIVVDESRIPEALVAIDDMAKKLGVKSCGRVPGKVYTYLERNRPEHLRAILAAEK